VKGRELARCRKWLGMTSELIRERLDTTELIKKLTGVDIHICPVCGAALIRAAPDI